MKFYRIGNKFNVVPNIRQEYFEKERYKLIDEVIDVKQIKVSHPVDYSKPYKELTKKQFLDYLDKVIVQCKMRIIELENIRKKWMI